MHMCEMESLCCTPVANTTLSTNYMSIKQINKEQIIDNIQEGNVNNQTINNTINEGKDKKDIFYI